MEWIIKNRGTGKTTEMLRLMRENPDMIMVCINAAWGRQLIKLNPDIDMSRFVTADQVRHGRLQGTRCRLLLEDYDQYIYQVLGNPSQEVVAVSLSPDV